MNPHYMIDIPSCLDLERHVSMEDILTPPQRSVPPSANTVATTTECDAQEIEKYLSRVTGRHVKANLV